MIAITCPPLSRAPRRHPAARRSLPAGVLQQERQAADGGHARSDGSADGVRMARQRARARERDRARGRAEQGPGDRTERPAARRSRRPKPPGATCHFPSARRSRRSRRRVIHATLDATPPATSAWPLSCSASRRARSTASSPARRSLIARSEQQDPMPFWSRRVPGMPLRSLSACLKSSLAPSPRIPMFPVNFQLFSPKARVLLTMPPGGLP